MVTMNMVGEMENLKVKVKYFDTELKHIELTKDGNKVRSGDWYDLRSASREPIHMVAGNDYLIYLGVAMELPKDKEAHILPRSGSFDNFGFILVNSEGIVDNRFNGDNDQWFIHVLAQRDGVINFNDRVAQFRLYDRQEECDFITVEKLGNPDRGGNGSTGIK